MEVPVFGNFAPALAVVKAAMAGTNSPWLFPQMRKRNADGDGDGTMAEGRQDVLRKRYSRSEQIALKTEPLEKWAEFVLAHVRRRRPDDRKDDLPACMCGGGESPDTGDDGDYVEGQARIVRPQFG